MVAELVVWESGTMESVVLVVHLKGQQGRANKGTFSFTAASVTEHLGDVWASLSWKPVWLVDGFYVTEQQSGIYHFVALFLCKQSLNQGINNLLHSVTPQTMLGQSLKEVPLYRHCL